MGNAFAHKARPQASAEGRGLAPPSSSAKTQHLVNDVLHSPGKPLDSETRAYMEPRFRHDFSKVRIHADDRAAEAASSIDARAFTLNRNIVFGPGEYAPQVESGRRLVAHELAHVVQQADSEHARYSTGVAPILGETQNRVEHEASHAADKVMRGGYAHTTSAPGLTAVILREPLMSRPEQSNSDKERLKKLFAAVEATSVGKTFLGSGRPRLRWGDTGQFHAQFDGNRTITLNEMEQTMSDCQWEQVIAMELGNFANQDKLNLIQDAALDGELSKEDYVEKIERTEFDSRAKVIDAYDAGEFGQPGAECPSMFAKVSFKDYMANPKTEVHRKSYEQNWETDCKGAYLKKHPPGK
jgi:Domain of unknown function (DUF4157)